MRIKNFASGQSVLKHQKPKGHERLIPFVTMYHPAVKLLRTLESDTQSNLAENNFYKTSDYLLQKGKSLKDLLVRAKM